MVVQYVEVKLQEKSAQHQADLARLGQESQLKPLSKRVTFLEQTTQLRGMNTIIHNIETSSEDFIFYFNRISTLLVEL